MLCCFFLGDIAATEFYVPTLRDTLFHLHKWGKFTLLMKMEWAGCSETSAHEIQTPRNHPKQVEIHA